MGKVSKKESLADLKNELVEKAINAVESVEVKTGEALESVSENIEDAGQEVKKKRFVSGIFRKLTVGRLLVVLLLLLAAGGIGGAGYFYWQYTNVQNQVLGTADQQEAEVKSIVSQVSELMELPSEQPTMATVSDKEQLKSQPFFDRSENGDKVLIYQSSKKAVLFRPSTNKIIDVATVNFGVSPTPAPDNATSVAVDEELSVIIWNGTMTTGLTQEAEPIVLEIPGATVAERDNATKRDYEKTIVVNVTGIKSQKVQDIAKAFEAEIVELPEDEERPEGDILIILGSDFVN